MRESALWLTGPAPAAAWRRRGVCATPCGRPVALGLHGVREAPAVVALGSVRMWVLCVSGRVGFPTSAAALLESPLLPLPPVVPCRGRELPDRLVSGGCGAGRGGQTPCLGLNDRVGKSCCRPRLPQVAVVRACARAGFGSAWARKHGCISGLVAGPGCVCGRIRVDVGSGGQVRSAVCCAVRPEAPLSVPVCSPEKSG